jgi:hypothetical protein
MSTAVERILRSDKTVNRFEIEGSEAYFEDICALVEGKSIIMSEKNCPYLQRLATIVEKEELLKKCLEFEIGKEISIANCIGKLETKQEFGCPIDAEIAFIASHFYEMDTEALKELKAETIENIVSHEDLCLRDEESLLEFVASLGEEYSFLYGYIECCFLTLEGIEEFLAEISEVSIDQRLWSSICRRLRCELSNRTLTAPRFVEQERVFDYREGHPFEGIIHTMTRECGGNIHEKNVVVITSSGGSRNMPFQVANHRWNDCWCSNNAPNSWICFDFRKSGVVLSHYTLKSHNYHTNGMIPSTSRGGR